MSPRIAGVGKCGEYCITALHITNPHISPLLNIVLNMTSKKSHVGHYCLESEQHCRLLLIIVSVLCEHRKVLIKFMCSLYLI